MPARERRDLRPARPPVLRHDPAAYDQVANTPRITLTGALADRLVHLRSLQFDLVATVEALDWSIRDYGPKADADPANTLMTTFVFGAAIVHYGRCFKQGRRHGAALDLQPSGEELATHLEMLRSRDRFVAHLDQAELREGGTAEARLTLDPMEIGVYVFADRLLVPHPDQLARFRAVAVGTLARAHAAVTELEGRIAEELFDHGQEALERAQAEGRPIRLLGLP